MQKTAGDHGAHVWRRFRTRSIKCIVTTASNENEGSDFPKRGGKRSSKIEMQGNRHAT